MSQFYRVTIKHDTGRDSVKVWATDAEQALNLVCKATGCPATAIIKIKEVKQ